MLHFWRDFLVRYRRSGRIFARNYSSSIVRSAEDTTNIDLTLKFRKKGSPRRAWKWKHYSPIYTSHLSKFRDQSLTIVEIGVMGGGSLEMWKTFFGPGARVIGVDIDKSCKALESEGFEIYIGDQASRAFWRKFSSEIKVVDVVIDDGGHRVDQQVVTFEALFPFIKPGGVYICEDVHGANHKFLDYLFGFMGPYFSNDNITGNVSAPNCILSKETNGIQSEVESVSFYPYCVVITKRSSPLKHMTAER